MSTLKPRIIVAMSGGVDSSVAAFLLKKEGYSVEGLYMKNWEEQNDSSHCDSVNDILDAESVCNQLDIPLHTINFSEEYWTHVFDDFLTEYQNGRTPNPDILCNKEIKFKTFLKYALSLGADYIATGHYVRKTIHNNLMVLQKGLDPEKDQSYFLYTLTQEALSKSLFPIGHLNKREVRKIAEKEGFVNHQKKDSTGICFIGERKFKNFLNQYVKAIPGFIETAEGKKIGTHEGLMFYTLGQRQGLKIGGIANTKNLPWYVVGKDMERNVLVVVQGDNHPLLYGQSLKVKDIHWITQVPQFPLKVQAKIRYRQADTPCSINKIEENHDLFHVTFECPQRAITPGQSIVFYDNESCLGGGIIQ